MLDRFAEQLDLEIIWPPSTEKFLRERLVSCDVSKVELEELLLAILQPIDLRHRKQGTRIMIERQQEAQLGDKKDQARDSIN